MLENMPVKTIPVGGRPVVRILPQPLYDTEVAAAAVAINELNFFAKPKGNPDASGTITSKTIANTNLTQSGSLAKPYEFDLFGFNLKVRSNSTSVPLTRGMFEVFFKDCAFQYLMGDRIYLTVPLLDMPTGIGFTQDGTTTADTTLVINNGVAHRSNLYNFRVQNYLVHIRSTENFAVKLSWPNASITPATTAVRVQVYMQGLLYNAI